MLSFRPATDEDWPIAWEIQRAAFLDLVTQTSGGWTDAQVQKCRDAWNPDCTRMLLYHDEVVGWLRLEHRLDHDWLDLVVLHPARQGAGLGTVVLQRLLAEAQEHGRRVELSVYKINRARQLYLRLGFIEYPRDELRVRMVWGGQP
ncbi:MAG TPA: GNAT family N-acetyltransferase [Myxococcota bacterium]|nr:GNAT family N-acetyltransferase [Myxococcota bacterium]HNH49528.1 GNAT family N-acetyltransferase [Myxococcota bacterium]